MGEHWPYFALAAFGVVSGQIGRLGRKLERDGRIAPRQFLVELSMLPAFGGLGGALAVEFHSPVWMVLATSITAGWLGFGTFTMLVNGVKWMVLRAAENMKRDSAQ